MTLSLIIIILVLASFTGASLYENVSLNSSKESRKVNIVVTNASFQSVSLHQLFTLKKADSDSIHLVFTPASQSMFFRSFFHSTNASGILLCTSSLCPKMCDACVAKTVNNPNTQMATTLAVLTDLKVSIFVFFYDEMVSISTMNAMNFLSNSSQTPHIPIRVDLSRNETIERLRRKLQSVISDVRTQYRHFVVLCGERSTRALLMEASRVATNNGLLNRQFFWILLSPITDTLGLLQQLPPYANLMIVRDQQKKACLRAMSSIATAFDVARRAATGCGSPATCYLSIRDAFTKCAVRATRVEVIASITRETRDRSVMDWLEVATYSTQSHSLEKKSALFPNTFHDFGGQTLLMGVVEIKPYITATNRTFMYRNITCHVVRGTFIDTITTLSQKLNFKSCYVYPPDGFYGDYNATSGISTGVIGMAHRKEIDFIAVILSELPSRARIIDFSFPVLSSPSGIIFPRQKPSKSMFQFLIPFDRFTWLTLMVSVVVIGFVTCLLSKRSPCSGVNLKVSNAVVDEVRAEHNLWKSLGFLMEQGQEHMPIAVSSRTVMICTWIFCLEISIHYSANLFTLLSLEDRKLPFHSIDEFSEQSDIRLIIQSSTALDNFFATSTDASLKKINQDAVRIKSDFLSLLDMVRNSSDQTWALTFPYHILREYEAHDCSKLAVIPETFRSDSTLAFSWPKNSFFADRMNFEIQLMAERGYFEKERDKMRRQTPCSGDYNAKTTFDPLGMISITGVLVLVLLFTMVAGVILCAEMII